MRKRNMRLKAAAALLLSAVMLSGAVLPSSAAKKQSAPLYRSDYLYPSGEFDKPVSDTFYYSDSYFSQPGTEINEHLRTMSAVLTFGGSPAANETVTAENITEIFTDAGFDLKSISAEEMDVRTEDSIGTVIAHKYIGGTPMIAVVIRGYDYGIEWISNVTAGAEGDPKGFSDAAAKVLDRIQTYRQTNGIEHTKLWITGFSRAGAVTNLVSRRINENPSAYGTSEEDIYAYSFEAANSSADGTVYKNIHNIINRNDLVPYFYPESWGVSLNGVKEYIGDNADTIQTRVFKISKNSLIQDFQLIKKSEFLRQFTDFLSENISREQYVSVLQDAARKMMAICMTKSGSQTAVLRDYFNDVMSSTVKDPSALLVIISVLGSPSSEHSVNAVTELLQKHMDDKKSAYELPLRGEEYQNIRDSIRPFASTLLTLAAADINYKAAGTDGKETDAPLYHLITFFENPSLATEEHSSYRIVENVKAKDSYYTDGVTVTPGNVYCGKWYNYDDYGDELFEQARALGFIDSDIKKLRDGYNLSIENTVTPLNELTAAEKKLLDGKLGDNEQTDSCFDVGINKKTGFRETPLNSSIQLRDNKVSVKAGNSSRKYAVYQLSENDAKEIGCSAKTVGGSIQITFNASGAGRYVLVYETEKAVASDSFLSALIGILLFAAISSAVFFVIVVLRNRTPRRRHRTKPKR